MLTRYIAANVMFLVENLREVRINREQHYISKQFNSSNASQKTKILFAVYRFVRMLALHVLHT